MMNKYGLSVSPWIVPLSIGIGNVQEIEGQRIL
jgi:hypothetical protein